MNHRDIAEAAREFRAFLMRLPPSPLRTIALTKVDVSERYAKQALSNAMRVPS